MMFSKTGNIYKIARITGSEDHILGVTFADKNNSNNNIEVIAWDRDFAKGYKYEPPTPKEEVFEQVLDGLESVNQSLGTNYKLSRIYFYPFDMRVGSIYSFLIKSLIRHYHFGTEFKETKSKD